MCYSYNIYYLCTQFLFMKKLILITILTIFGLSLSAQNDNVEKKKIFQGYDGGMMLHAGYIKSYNYALGMSQEGWTKGIGGAIRFHFGEHYRIGTEGYVSNLGMLGNDSYIKTFWAGLLNDFYWQFGKFMPYAGLTLGGGTVTNCYIIDGITNDWEAEEKVIFKKDAIVAIDPFIGCDYCVTDAMHLTFKIDYLMGIGNKSTYFPQGPRFYIGFIFFH